MSSSRSRHERLLDALNFATDEALTYARDAVEELEIQEGTAAAVVHEALEQIRRDIDKLLQIRAEFLQDYTQN